MLAIQYRKTIPGFLAVKFFGRRFPRICTSRIAPTRLVDIPEPTLPGDRWVKIKTTLGAVCGSDLSTVACKGSPFFSPFLSFPFVLGHENVGIVTETGPKVSGFRPGDRVITEPVLGCEVRDILPPCPPCERGDYGLCENVIRGKLSRGIQTGYCRDTGGSWGEYFVAHQSQLHHIPNEMDDDNAVLIEPFTTALHAAIRHFPKDNERVLVIGAGSIGLMVIQALRGLGSKAEILCVARYPHQAELATRFGADRILKGGSSFDREIAEATGAEILKPELGHNVIVGGIDRTFDCVASSVSLDDATRSTRAAGTVVVMGMPGIPSGIDWTPIWYKSLSVTGCYCYGWENTSGGRRRTIEMAIDLVAKKKVDLKPLLTHRFDVRDFRNAFDILLGGKKASKACKVVFSFNG